MTERCDDSIAQGMVDTPNVGNSDGVTTLRIKSWLGSSVLG